MKRIVILCKATLILVYFGMPGATAAGEEAPQVVTKGAAWCNNGACGGLFSETIDHIYTPSNGKVTIVPTQRVLDHIITNGICTINDTGNTSFIFLEPDGDGGEETILTQLYISRVLDSWIVVKVSARPSDGKCQVDYTRALYSTW